MHDINTSIGWNDFIDTEKYDRTGEALLYRNPYKLIHTENSNEEFSKKYEFSTSTGENYIFDQQPIAFGFTAFIGFDAIKPHEYSLKSDKVAKRIFKTEAYYIGYTLHLHQLQLLRNNMLPRPKTQNDFETHFYTDQLSKEEEFLKLSEKYYTECLDEKDRELKEDLYEYVGGYFDWINKKIIELNPDENNFKGLGGLSEAAAEYIYKEFQGEFIHSMTKQEYFVAIFQNRFLPVGWKRVEWVGIQADKAALFSFFKQVFGTEIKPGIIKKYFKVADDNLHGHHRTVTENPDIKKILDYAKTIRPRK